MRWASKDSARAVTHENKIRDPNGKGDIFVKWMFNTKASIKPKLWRLGDICFGRSDFGAFFTEVLVDTSMFG